MGFQNCACKIKKCPECGECPKHDCSHDGIALSAKANRKRGRQPGKQCSSSSGRKRAVVDYAKGNEVEDCSEKLQFNATKCKTINDIVAALGLDGKYVVHFPSQNVRRTESDPEHIERYSSMVSFAQSCVKSLCELIYPANPSVLETALNRDKRIKARSETLIQQMGLLGRNMKRKSIEQRIMYANLANVLSRQDLSHVVHPDGSDITARSFASMRQDYQCLENDHGISVEKRSVRRYRKETVTAAVKFILGPSNAQVLSWGERKLFVGSKIVKLPKVTRKRIPQYIYTAYREICPNPHIVRSKFYEIVNATTCNDMMAVSAVDYTTGVLIHDTCDRLLRIIDRIELEDKREHLKKLLNCATVLLKRHLDSAVMEDDATSIQSHSFEYGLSSSATSELAKCSTCPRPFEILSEIRNSADPELRSFFDDAEEKFKLFLGHRYALDFPYLFGTNQL